MLDIFNAKFDDDEPTVDLKMEIDLEEWEELSKDRDALIQKAGEQFVRQMEEQIKEYKRYRRYSQYEDIEKTVFCWPVKIVVQKESDKEELLKAFEYIHSLREIDNDIIAVNTIMHMYQHPNLIEVDENLKVNNDT